MGDSTVSQMFNGQSKFAASSGDNVDCVHQNEEKTWILWDMSQQNYQRGNITSSKSSPRYKVETSMQMYLSKWREHLNIVRYVLRIINVEIWLHPNLIVQCRSFVDAFVHVRKKSEKRIFSNDGNPQSKFAFFWKRLVWIKTRENHNESSLINFCELQEKWWCFYVIVCFLNIGNFGKSCEYQTENELRE